MNYEIQILRRALRSLARLPRREYERVRDAIRALADEPRPPGCRKLTGRDGWRIRIGQYRVIYEISKTSAEQPCPFPRERTRFFKRSSRIRIYRVSRSARHRYAVSIEDLLGFWSASNRLHTIPRSSSIFHNTSRLRLVLGCARFFSIHRRPLLTGVSRAAPSCRPVLPVRPSKVVRR